MFFHSYIDILQIMKQHWSLNRKHVSSDMESYKYFICKTGFPFLSLIVMWYCTLKEMVILWNPLYIDDMFIYQSKLCGIIH